MVETKIGGRPVDITKEGDKIKVVFPPIGSWSQTPQGEYIHSQTHQIRSKNTLKVYCNLLVNYSSLLEICNILMI